MKKDKDKDCPDKDNEHEICVISWNINKSSARYDFLRDMAQCQVDAAMFQETQNWHHEDGTAAEIGWNLLEKEGKTAVAVRKRNMKEALEARSQKYKMGILCAGKHLVSLYVLASHVEWRTEP